MARVDISHGWVCHCGNTRGRHGPPGGQHGTPVGLRPNKCSAFDPKLEFNLLGPDWYDWVVEIHG